MWFAAAYSCLLSSVFSFAAWGRGASRARANKVLVYQYLVALIGGVAGILLRGEGFGLQQMIGAAVIVVGAYLARGVNRSGYLRRRARRAVLARSLGSGRTKSRARTTISMRLAVTLTNASAKAPK